MQKKLLLLIIIVVVNVTLFAQTSTIRVMQYNLLTYGDQANPTNYKDSRLKTIIAHVQPDIFGANEIDNSPAMSNNILNNVLGSDWEKAAYSNTTNDFQTNMLFWKSDKFMLKSQVVITSIVRDVIAYRLYYKDNTSSTTDSVFVTIIVGHLKAGEAPEDATERVKETAAVVNYLNSLGSEANYLFMGDFNLYSSTEQAYQNMVSSTNKYSHFNDPINRPGQWHSNQSFAGIHTQSTRTTNLSDNGVSGGLDDRFDFILLSDPVLNSKLGMRYVTNSYKTIGQDGSHYNKSVNAAPANTSAPANVIQALYEFSDHLPVTADFVFDPSTVNVADVDNILANGINVINPVSNSLTLFFSAALCGKDLRIDMYNSAGAKVVQHEYVVDNSRTEIDLPSLPQGVYVLYIRDAQGGQSARRLVKF